MMESSKISSDFMEERAGGISFGGIDRAPVSSFSQESIEINGMPGAREMLSVNETGEGF